MVRCIPLGSSRTTPYCWLLAIALVTCAVAPASALTWPRDALINVDKNLVRAAHVLLQHYTYNVSGETVTFNLPEVRIDAWRFTDVLITWRHLPATLLEELRTGGGSMDQMATTGPASVRLTASVDDLRDAIYAGLRKQAKPPVIGPKFTFRPTGIALTGTLDPDAIPGFPQIPGVSGSQITFAVDGLLQPRGATVDATIAKLELNGYDMAGSAMNIVLGWLNPIWDFSWRPYRGRIDQLHVGNGTITLEATLFGQ